MSIIIQMSNSTHVVDAYGMTEEIEAFDRLPPNIRHAIAYSAYTISSKMALNLYNTLQNEQMVLTAIKQIEQQFEAGVL